MQNIARQDLEVLGVAEEGGFLHGDPVQEGLQTLRAAGDGVDVPGVVLRRLERAVADRAAEATRQAGVSAKPDPREQQGCYPVDRRRQGLRTLGGCAVHHARTSRTARWIAAASLSRGSTSVTAPRRAAAFGIPKTAEDARSCPNVCPPC